MELTWLISTLKFFGWLFKKLSGHSLDKHEQEADKAIEHARSVFHDRYGDAYGPSGSTFIDREDNKKKLLRSTFPRGKRLTVSDLDCRGFDEAPDAPEEAGILFLNTFYQKIYQPSSRVLDRDLSHQDASRERHEILGAVDDLADKINLIVGAQVSGRDPKLEAALSEESFPDTIRDAITEPNLDELSELMKTGQVKQALSYAERRIEAINTALEKIADPEKRCVEVVRTYRQRLLLAAAMASSWQGDIESGRSFWWRACDLGPIDPKWHEQAAATLFNIKLKRKLRDLIAKMDQESDAYQKSTPLLAYLDKDWSSVDELLADAQGADLLLLRIWARLKIIDPKDAKAVQTTAGILDQTDDDTVLPGINLDRAHFTLELLQLVIREYTPLDYDRRPLIDNLVRRLHTALESTEPDSLFRAQALGRLGIAGELLRDDELLKLCSNGVEALEENIRSSVSLLYDPTLSPEKLDALLSKGQISITQAAILKAKLHRDSGQDLKFERELSRALFETPDKRQRSHVLRLLAQHLRQKNRIEEVQRLIDTTPLRPADRWLLGAENLPVGKTPLDIVDKVEEFPLDVDAIEHLAQFTLSTVAVTSREDSSPDSTNLDRANQAVHWTTRLVKVLPSGSSRLLHAHALYAARRYEDLLAVSRDLDSVHGEYAAEFEAWALVGLGRKDKAISVFVSACTEFPESARLVVNTAGLLLAEGRASEAVNLLKPRVENDSQDPDILFSYSKAIRAQAPGSQDHASQAFDLLSRAYSIRSDQRIAREAWEAGQAAGRGTEAGYFYNAMMAEAPVKVVKTEDDFYQAMRAVKENLIVQIEGGFEYLAKSFRKEEERLNVLEKFRTAHILAYVDFFRHYGRSWELWALWTQKFERLSSKGEMPPGEFSVLADWSPLNLGYDHQHNAKEVKLFLDQTAILTLGVLGPKTAGQILTALRMSYVLAGTVGGLREELSRISGHLLSDGAALYVKAVDFISKRPDVVVRYSEKIESIAPNDAGIGPCHVDLGVAILHNALYVTDLDNFQDWSDEANQLRISSATLLASLNQVGKVKADEARVAAQKYPNVFTGWDNMPPQPIPGAIVFGEYSLLDWVDSGLIEVLGDRVKIGPWTWRRISEETEHHEAMKLAHERLQDTIEVLQSALDRGTVVEIKEVANGDTHEDATSKPEGDNSSIEEMWSGALRSLRTAHAKGLQLWADDRFYPFLLRWGGPTKLGPKVEAIREPFAAWAKEKPVISTAELLRRLSSAERLGSEVAQNAAAGLFAQGYRMAHPILFGHALRQFPVPESGPLTHPFQKLVDSIAEIPRYLLENSRDYYPNRSGLIRVASMRLAEQYIVGVWEADGLSNDQRGTLASAFLEAVEHVSQEVSSEFTDDGSERNSIMFWQSVAYALQTMSAQDEQAKKLRYEALCWLGEAAASRANQLENIVRVLEDNLLDSLKYALKALEENVSVDQFPQVISIFVVPALVPLSDNGTLINKLDPLMRRTVGTLARFNRDGRINVHYYATAERDGTRLEVSEEENEEAAAEALTRAIAGDSNCAQFVRATNLIFSHILPAPKEWIDEGYPTDEFPIDVRCSLFTLLWADPPRLREIIIHLLVHHLSVIDPSLAYNISLIENDLLSDDTEKMQEASDKLGIKLLRSGYFDLQRDLVHALRRFRHYDTEDFVRFIGWIGEEPADTLFNHTSNPQVCQIGQHLVPTAHYWGRALLTDQLDDKNLILECAKQLIFTDNDPNRTNSNSPTLVEWLENRASLAENAPDPFVAAWALRAILLVGSTMNQNPEVNINGQVAKVLDWATNYMEAALAGKKGQPSELAKRIEDRRRLASAALLLAAFACSGHKHIETYKQSHDPHAIWLVHIWMLASKLQVALVGFHGGMADAAEVAVTAVQKLNLGPSGAYALDAFDPFVFGFGGDDIGVALTLTAMLKAGSQLREDNGSPVWWTDTIQSRVIELANADPKEPTADNEGLENRFGLIAPLRVRILARKLIESLASSVS